MRQPRVRPGPPLNLEEAKAREIELRLKWHDLRYDRDEMRARGEEPSERSLARLDGAYRRYSAAMKVRAGFQQVERNTEWKQRVEAARPKPEPKARPPEKSKKEVRLAEARAAHKARADASRARERERFGLQSDRRTAAGQREFEIGRRNNQLARWLGYDRLFHLRASDHTPARTQAAEIFDAAWDAAHGGQIRSPRIGERVDTGGRPTQHYGIPIGAELMAQITRMTSFEEREVLHRRICERISFEGIARELCRGEREVGVMYRDALEIIARGLGLGRRADQRSAIQA